MNKVDPCFRDILQHPKAHIRAPAVTADIGEFRSAIDAPMKAVTGPEVAQVIDLIGRDGRRSVPLRLYRASIDKGQGPVIVFIHGGGFVAGSLDTHDAICRTLCRDSGVSVLSIEYRLAPENAFPAAIDDCCSAMSWILREGARLGLDAEQLALCGDSVGGYLAVATALAMRDLHFSGEIRHIGLLYPAVEPSCHTASMDAFGEGYILTRGALQWFWEAFSNSREAREAELSMLKRDLSGLPPVSVVTAGFDPLRDEGTELFERLKRAGVETSLRCYVGMVHGFASLIHLTDLAGNAILYLADRFNAGFGRPGHAVLLPVEHGQAPELTSAANLSGLNELFHEERAPLP